MKSVYVDGSHKLYVEQLLKYIYKQEVSKLNEIEFESINPSSLTQIDSSEESGIEIEYSIHIPPDGYSLLRPDGNVIKVYNMTIDDGHEMNSEGRYFKNITLKFESEDLQSIKQLFKECFEYWENYNTNSTTNVKINILKYDYGWTCYYKCSKRPIDTVILPLDVKSQLMEDIEFFKSDSCKLRYKDLSLTHTRTYMFYGPPGTGKTSLVRALASKYEMSIAIIDFDSEMDDKRLRHCIQRLPKNTILLLEDIDCLFNSRTTKDNNNSLVTFSGLLNALDGVVQNNDTIIIITTNHICKLDEALKRRIDYFLKFDYASKSQIRTMFVKFFPDYESKFLEFYDKIYSKNLTTNIIQKFFTKYLFKDITNYTDDLKAFINTEQKNDMYI